MSGELPCGQEPGDCSAAGSGCGGCGNRPLDRYEKIALAIEGFVRQGTNVDDLAEDLRKAFEKSAKLDSALDKKGLNELVDYCLNLGQSYSHGQIDLAEARAFIMDAIRYRIDQEIETSKGIGRAFKLMLQGQEDLRSQLDSSLFHDIETTLVDLHACDDPNCPDCQRVLPRVREMIRELESR